MKKIGVHTTAQPQRHLRLLLLLSVTVLGVLVIKAGGASTSVHAYGSKTPFTKGDVVKFPDFDLTYLGERKISSPVFKAGFIYHDFFIAKGEESEAMSWSSGTGEIAPQSFEVAGQWYQLELRYAEGVGWLKDDELVIRRK